MLNVFEDWVFVAQKLDQELYWDRKELDRCYRKRKEYSIHKELFPLPLHRQPVGMGHERSNS